MTLYGVSVLLAPDHGLVGLTIIATGALKSTCVEVAGTNTKLCVLDPILRMLSTAVSVRTLVSQRCGTFPILSNLGMKSCGPEFSNLGSVKLTTHGHRRILTMKFKSAIQLWAASVASGTVRTAKNICECVENADKKAMEPYVADKSLKAAELGPGDCLILPPGYIVVESVLNNVAVQGIRTVMMPSVISEDFALSLDCFMPENWSLIKTNTSQAFLKRLVQTYAKIASTKTEIKNATTPKLAIAMKIEPNKKPIAA